MACDGYHRGYVSFAHSLLYLILVVGEEVVVVVVAVVVVVIVVTAVGVVLAEQWSWLHCQFVKCISGLRFCFKFAFVSTLILTS